jgi:hypothetical protein
VSPPPLEPAPDASEPLTEAPPPDVAQEAEVAGQAPELSPTGAPARAPLGTRLLALARENAPLVVAACLCLFTIGRWTLWQDEAFTWNVTLRPFEGVVDAAAKDRHPPLYYLTVLPLHRLSDFDYAIRLPSALAFLVMVAVTHRAGVRHLGERAGGLLGWLVALSPFAVLFAHTARMYALLGAFGAVLFAGGLALARNPRPWGGALGILLGASGAIWTHYAGGAAIAAAGLATGLTILTNGELSWRSRFGRAALLVGAMTAAGASFLPWATGALKYQLQFKDAPSARTWEVLGYLRWCFDSRIPLLSWALLLLQPVGLLVAARRRQGLGVYLWTWALVGVIAPYAFSKSQPAQNPRNYIDFLPAAMALAALGLDALPKALPGRWIALALGLMAAEPLHDLLTRPVSPQEPGPGFDYRAEAMAWTEAMPKEARALFRPGYMLTQYERYSRFLTGAAKDVRTAAPGTWLLLARGEGLDPQVQATYPERCVFRHGFRVVTWAPRGSGCEALEQAIASETAYVPFLLERGQRLLLQGDAKAAAEAAALAEARLGFHPAAALLLARAHLQAGDGEAALRAAERAEQIHRDWRMGVGAVVESIGLQIDALRLLGRREDVARAEEEVRCLRAAPRPMLCGTALELLAANPFAPMPEPNLVAVGALPPPTEEQDPSPPEAPPVGADLYALWTFEETPQEGLPDDWRVLAGEVATAPTAEGQTLVVRTSPDVTSSAACGPLQPVAPRMSLRARWRASIAEPSGELDPGAGAQAAPATPGPLPQAGAQGRTWVALEARATDANGIGIKVAGAPGIARPFQVPVSTDWRTDRAIYVPPPAAKGVRFCLKIDGPLAGEGGLDWMEVARIPER